MAIRGMISDLQIDLHP